MSKISKDKRNKVILVWTATLLVGCAWGFGLVTWQLASQRKAERDLEQRRAKAADMFKAITQHEKIEQEVEATGQKLAALEDQMATGDAYSWVNKTVREFNKPAYKLVIPQIGQPVIADNTLLPKFPYRQASVTVAGTAFFHDLGRFITDFENRFPFARLINLEVNPASGTGDSEREKLNFKMEMIFLVKPN